MISAPDQRRGDGASCLFRAMPAGPRVAGASLACAFLAGTSFIATSAVSASSAVSAASATSAAAAADRFEIDPAHSHVQFSVRRFGFNAIIGEFRDVAGVVLLEGDSLSGGSVVASVQTASLVSGDATRDGHVRGEHWLNAAKYPTIQFRSTSVQALGRDAATVRGDLTLLGVTRAVSLDVRFNKRGIDPSNQKEAAGFSATGMLRRSDFGLQTAPQLIGEEVAIRIEVLAHLAAQGADAPRPASVQRPASFAEGA